LSAETKFGSFHATNDSKPMRLPLKRIQTPLHPRIFFACGHNPRKQPHSATQAAARAATRNTALMMT